MEQDDINMLLVEKARGAGVVVRLKGGDPFIFGRGGEEALVLARHNIPFEIVNGISSAYAAASYAGIPVTHRGLASSVAFITGHEDPTKEDTDIDWEKLATGVQTLVFLMGVKNLPVIVDQLVKHGRSPETPVALVHRGTQPSQKTAAGTLKTIVDEVHKRGIRAPSVIIVGDVVSLRDSLAWFDKRPLSGKTIVVTRAREQASEVTEKLNELGARVIEVPAISIAPVDDTAEIRRNLDKLGSFDWLVFTSVNGVIHFFKHLNDNGMDSRELHSLKICAIGPATAGELARHGIRADAVPEKYISTKIIEHLTALNEVKGNNFLMPRADIAPPLLRDELIQHGAETVIDMTIYRTIHEDIDPDSPEAGTLTSLSFDMVTFASSSTVKNFASLMQSLGVHDFSAVSCAAIGPVTADTARDLGFRVVTVADEHTIPGLIRKIIDGSAGME